jgi:hypothetical protein
VLSHHDRESLLDVPAGCAARGAAQPTDGQRTRNGRVMTTHRRDFLVAANPVRALTSAYAVNVKPDGRHNPHAECKTLRSVRPFSGAREPGSRDNRSPGWSCPRPTRAAPERSPGGR